MMIVVIGTKGRMQGSASFYPGYRSVKGRYGTRTRYKSRKTAGEGMDKAAVLVDSRGGHTRKVALAIAEELGTGVGDITKPLPDAEILFLGSGMYGTGPGLFMNRLLRTGTFTWRKVALFATASYPGDGEKMLGSMAETLEKKGAKVLGNPPSRGRVIIVRYRHPHPGDLEDAKKWAREIVGK
jgi:flavodoxin